MMKNKKTKIIVNGVVLAVMAAMGITVYQLGTSPSKEKVLLEEVQDESEQEEPEEELAEEPEEETLVDAGTRHVQAQMEEQLPTEKISEQPDVQKQEVDSLSEEAVNPQAMALNLPEVNFSEETLMEWPVNGNILVDYNMEGTTYFPTLDQYRLSPAIAVQAVEGAPVVSAVNGTVYSIKEDAKTGTTVTMELGNGYQAVYGQLKDLNVSEGETVTKGTTIGYVSAPTKYYSEEGSNLYFAMKKDGNPIDPIMYLP